MSDQFFSSSWYRVAKLCPVIKQHIVIRRQEYRGDIWYVAYDQVAAQNHRLTPAAHSVIALLDGETTVEQAWLAAAELLGDDLPNQEEIIQLLTVLHQADILATPNAPDLDELQSRYEKKIKSERLRRFINPLALKFKIFDPEKLLQHIQPVAAIFFNRWAIFLWLATVIAALSVLATHWFEFTEGMADKLLSIDNLLIMGLVFPVVKAFHELGHALAVKKWGGEVHDIGIMFLVFMPVPYVDASSSWIFQNKYHRMVVGAAGMLVELFIASIALMVWSNSEPGLLRTLLYNAVLIAGLSTLLFNANPLLRFDGYYILMDWLEIPNLGARANKYFSHLCKWKLLGMPEGTENWGEPAERRWLVFYAVASYLYRLILSFTIAIFVASKFFVVGVVLAAWALTMTVILPIFKLFRFLFWASESRRFRKRAVQASALVISAFGFMLFWMPFPHLITAEGVVWIPEENHVRAGVDGFSSEVLVRSGVRVKKGDTLILFKDPEKLSRRAILEQKLIGYQARYRALAGGEKIEAEVVKDEMEIVQSEILDLEDSIAKLSLKAPIDGVFFLVNERDIGGRFFKKGQQLGYVVSEEQTVVRVAVAQNDIAEVRKAKETVMVKFSSDILTTLHSTIIREVPGATHRLPSMALTQQGGGKLPNDPNEQQSPSSYDQVFLVDLAIAKASEKKWLGERVYVRFDQGYASFWQQNYRHLKQLFIRLSNF